MYPLFSDMTDCRFLDRRLRKYILTLSCDFRVINFSSANRNVPVTMLQYLVDDYLGGCGLPQIRTVAGRRRLGVNANGDRYLISTLTNQPVRWQVPDDVVSIRFEHEGYGIYLLFSDMRECCPGVMRQVGECVSHAKLQLYLESSE